MLSAIKRVEKAIDDLKQGKMIILTDDTKRENEGDLVIPAENITVESMNFMIRHGSGIVCLPLTVEQLKKLNLPLMVSAEENTSAAATPFTISIDPKNGSGVSAADRVRTIQLAIHEDAHPDDIARPGHVFPLQAKQGGVFERQGHTEGSIDLARLAGFKPATVICEIMNPDGTMMHGEQLIKFAQKHALSLLSVEDIVAYRLQHESFFEEESSTLLPLKSYGLFKIKILREKINKQEIIILTKTHDTQPPLVRIHSACATGDLFSSQRCDCYDELHYSLTRISQEGGILIYLPQEGRGIGLLNKIKAYALQDAGFDTVEANEKLHLPVDARKYDLAAYFLLSIDMQHVRLLTNNPNKTADLEKFGIQVTQEAMPLFHNEYNLNYLLAKKEKLNHTIHLDLTSNKD